LLHVTTITPQEKGERQNDMKIQTVIDTILSAIPGAPPPETVDLFKCGDPSREVTGIVTTFLASVAVVQQAVGLKANLIISHEPVFYNHLDRVDWLQDDPVYTAKRKLLDDHDIVVWRFHDCWHMHQPDGITTGVLKDLGWAQRADADHNEILTFDGLPLGDLVQTIKQRLDVPEPRVIGSLAHPCRRVGLLLGSSGGRSHIEAFRLADLDTLVVGETNEWDTTEYVRDAIALGLPKALVVIGHEKSEEAGMKYLVEWLRLRLPASIAIVHIPSGDPFQRI
jgi:putative NIF3 family GTP cyclohydrolase 1 type 2